MQKMDNPIGPGSARSAPAQTKTSRLEESGAEEILAIKRQVKSFKLTRRARQTEIAEDYVELIADLIAMQGEARNVDIGHRLGVTHATVNKTLMRLCREGLVVNKPYRSIFLTDAGRKVAENSKRRHLIVVAFLRKIGISEEQANIDAEGIEHYASEETLAAFARIASTKVIKSKAQK